MAPAWLVLVLILGLAVASGLSAHSDLLTQIEQLDQQIAEQGATPARLLKRGDLYRRHEDYDAAARDFEAARALDPDNEELEFFIGRLQLETGDYPTARQSIVKYLESYPDHARGWSLLGETEVRLGQPEAAADCFGQAIAQSSSASPELYRAQVLSLLAAGKSNRDGAALVVEQGLQSLGPEVNLLGLAVDIALAEARREQAAGLLGQLPKGLERLPQWSQRHEWADCTNEACVQLANEALEDQVQIFMQGN